MGILYRVFYTVFLLSLVSGFVMLCTWLIRLVFRNIPKKYLVSLWVLAFIRSLCPVAMSSPISITNGLNRAFHRILPQLGITISGNEVLMTGWGNVFTHNIKVDISYAICAAVWGIGVVIILIYTYLRQMSVRNSLSEAKLLFDNVYQLDGLKTPVITGVFCGKFYIPAGIKAEDAKYLIHHYDMHKKRLDGVWKLVGFLAVALHWFNPLMWYAYYLMNRDIELAADMETVEEYGKNDKSYQNKYAQQIVNMSNGEMARRTVLTFDERFTDARAEKMLYCKKMHKQDKVFAMLIIFLCFLWWFALRPLQIVWSGSMGNGVTTVTDEKLFKKSDETQVAKLVTTSPDGLDRTVRLVMRKGTYSKEKGYRGVFSLKLEDAYGTEFASRDLNELYEDAETGEMHFDKGTKLYAADYNGDGVQEVMIGNPVLVTDSQARKITGDKQSKEMVLQKFYLWDIDNNDFASVTDGIYADRQNDTKSYQFEIPKDTTGVISTKINKKTMYYVWDSDSLKYVYKDLTKKQLDFYKNGGDGVSADAGKTQEHKLSRDDGSIAAQANTKISSNGDEVIQKIVLDPRGDRKEISDIEGYYCALKWANDTSVSLKRYAVLTYNGRKAQTFSVYDTKTNSVYYEQEDGNSVLQSVFQQYNMGNIKFGENNVVVYSLMEKDGDMLKINFAADAGTVTINGTYSYNVATGKVSEFNYTQNDKE